MRDAKKALTKAPNSLTTDKQDSAIPDKNSQVLNVTTPEQIKSKLVAILKLNLDATTRDAIEKWTADDCKAVDAKSTDLDRLAKWLLAVEASAKLMHSDVTNTKFALAIFGQLSPHVRVAAHSCEDSATSNWKPTVGLPTDLPNSDKNSYYCPSSLKSINNTYNRDLQHFDALHVLVLDDISPMVLTTLPPPTYALATSKDNYQVGYKLTSPLRDVTKARHLHARLQKAGYCDKSGNNPVRWVRLPVGRNFNSKKGKNISCELMVWQPEVTHDADDLCTRLALPEVEIKEHKVHESTGKLHYAINDNTAADLRAHLAGIDADIEDNWYKVCAALVHSGPIGRTICHEWSSTSTKYAPDDTDSKMDQFATKGASHYAAIFNMKIDLVDEVPDKKPAPKDFTLHGYFKIHTLSNEAADKMSVTKFIYPNLIPQGLITAYPSPANGGKTAIFTMAACEMADDGYDILYINADASPSQLKAQQIKADKHGFKILAPDAVNAGGVTGLIKTLTELSTLDVDLSKTILIIDTLKKFTDMLSKTELKSFISLLRKLQASGATVCLLCHTNKYPTLSGDLIYEGTSDLRNDIDNLVYLYSSLVEKGVREVTTAPDKTRATFEPISFRISFGDWGVDVEELDEVLPCFTDESREVFNTCVNAITEDIRGSEELVQYVKEALMVGDNKAREKIKTVLDMKHSPLVRMRSESGRGFTFRLKSEVKTDFSEF